MHRPARLASARLAHARLASALPQRHFCLHPNFIPGYDHTTMSTLDGMHLEDDGNLLCKLTTLCMHATHLASARLASAHLVSSFTCTHRITSTTFADHGYWTMWMAMVKLKWFTLKEANGILAAAPPSTWSDGLAIPLLHKHVLKGAKSGNPKRGGKLRYKAADMRKFALARCEASIISHAPRISHACLACMPRMHASHAASHAASFAV